MLYQARKKVDHSLCYSKNQQKIKGSFDILNDISEHIMLVKFTEEVGNVNHAVSIYVNWVFYSKNDRALPLEK